ncbi:hypothetical protein [Sphingomonas koreensis]
MALYIAGSEQRSAERQRRAAANEDHERRAQVIAEAMRLGGEVETLAGRYAELVTLGGGTSLANRADLLDDLDGIRRQLESLQKFPMADPRLFAEIGRAASDCRVEAGLNDKSTSYAELIMKRVGERLAGRRESLAKLCA